MHEDIIHFPPGVLREEAFRIQMAGISYCDGTYRITRKKASICVFEYILEGQGTVITNNRTYYPAKGDIYILHEGQNHLYYSDDKAPWTKIWFNLEGPLIDHLLKAYGLEDVHYIPAFDLSADFSAMLDLAGSWEKGPRTQFREAALLFHQMLIKIKDQWHLSMKNAPSGALLIKNYLEQHVADRITLDALGKHFFLSPSQLIRTFKKEYGITPYTYLLNRKIDYACILLKDTLLPVKEISLTLHFADEHYFCSCFKTRTGLSPLKYRKYKQSGE